MKHWIVPVAAFGLITLVSCVSAQDRTVADGHSDINGNRCTSLPVLLGTPVKPVAEAQGFQWRWGTYAYTVLPEPAPGREIFQSDKEAIEAGEAFLRRNFGTLADPLRATVEREPQDGRKAAEARWSVTFHQWHDGMPLVEAGASLYFSGRTVTFAKVILFTLQPVPGSERPIIPREEAIALFDKQMAEWTLRKPTKHQGMPDIHADPRKVSLKYVPVRWERENGGIDPDVRSVFRPNYQMYLTVMMDAITGQIWRNG